MAAAARAHPRAGAQSRRISRRDLARLARANSTQSPPPLRTKKTDLANPHPPAAPGHQAVISQIYFHGDRFVGSGDTAARVPVRPPGADHACAFTAAPTRQVSGRSAIWPPPACAASPPPPRCPRSHRRAARPVRRTPPCAARRRPLPPLPPLPPPPRRVADAHDESAQLQRGVAAALLRCRARTAGMRDGAACQCLRGGGRRRLLFGSVARTAWRCTCV